MNVIDKIEREQMKTDIPEFGPGDTVDVHTRVIEGGKERIQKFKG
ncbi:MAG: 50S ribosomal protein L19, partial [Verrucomicrobiota bacterium]